MPKISLVVCLYKERDLLERLLQHAEGCYDDLVVVHDGVEEAVAAGDRRSEVGDRGAEIAQETTDYPGSRSASIPIINHPSSVISHHPSVINQQSAINNQQPSEARQTAAGSPQGELKANQFPSYEDGWKSPEELSLKEPDAPPIEIARDYAELPKDALIPTGYRLKTGIPQPGSVHELVARYGGRFYEGPRCFQQEPHWPFAWWAAKNDWILRLDADEFPSANLMEWIIGFKRQGEDRDVVGYLAIWPLWNGQFAVTQHWPNGRPFLINSQYHDFFGMVEQTATSNREVTKVNLILVHAPVRKSYGVRNIVFRKQAYIWRSVIAGSLMESPLKLPRWRCQDNEWPEPWRTKLKRPLFQAMHSLIWFPLCQARNMWRYEGKIDLSACLNPALHHFLLQIAIFLKKHFP